MSEAEEKQLKKAMDEDDKERPMTRKELFDYLDNWWLTEGKAKFKGKETKGETDDADSDEERDADGHRISGPRKTLDRAFRLPKVRGPLEAVNRENREFWKGKK